MKLDQFIEGLQILRRHFDKDGYHIGSEHDEFHVYQTTTPLAADEAARMKELNWLQPDAARDDEDNVPYDPSEGWIAYT